MEGGQKSRMQAVMPREKDCIHEVSYRKNSTGNLVRGPSCYIETDNFSIFCPGPSGRLDFKITICEYGEGNIQTVQGGSDTLVLASFSHIYGENCDLKIRRGWKNPTTSQFGQKDVKLKL